MMLCCHFPRSLTAFIEHKVEQCAPLSSTVHQVHVLVVD
mgnify:CR=1 FL=1